MQNFLKLGVKKDETYIAKGHAHLKKMKWFAQRGSNLILAQTILWVKGIGIFFK
jgi:hypothetical protein